MLVSWDWPIISDLGTPVLFLLWQVKELRRNFFVTKVTLVLWKPSEVSHYGKRLLAWPIINQSSTTMSVERQTNHLELHGPARPPFISAHGLPDGVLKCFLDVPCTCRPGSVVRYHTRFWESRGFIGVQKFSFKPRSVSHYGRCGPLPNCMLWSP